MSRIVYEDATITEYADGTATPAGRLRTGRAVTGVTH